MKKKAKPEPMDLHVLIEKEGRLYSALCLELDVASQGRSVVEAKKNIAEAVQLYLEDVYADGEEKDFISRPAPLEEWLKYFQKSFAPKTLTTMIRQSGLTEQEWRNAARN